MSPGCPAGHAVLTFRLAGPMQSWSVSENLGVKAAGTEPSKSGVLGLVAAALGRARDADMSDLRDLGLLVRVDAPGQVVEDYHTVSRYRRPHRRGKAVFLPDVVDGLSAKEFAPESKHTLIKRQNYLCDAVFLVALISSDSAGDELLVQIERALAAPVFPLYLGRKACPAEPLMAQLHTDVVDPVVLMRELPWAGAGGRRRRPEALRLVGEEALLGTGSIPARRMALVADVPVGHRRFETRVPCEQAVPWPAWMAPGVRGFSD